MVDGQIKVEPHASRLRSMRAMMKVKDWEAWASWIWYTEDPRSTYAALLKEERQQTAMAAIFGKQLPVPREVTELAEEIQGMKTSAELLLDASRSSVAQLTAWLNTVDPTDEEYDVTKHLKVLADVGKVVNSLTELEKAVQTQMNPSETYGGAELTDFNR